MYIKKLLTILIFALCIVPSFAQVQEVEKGAQAVQKIKKIKGLRDAKGMNSLTDRLVHLMRLNPGVSIVTLKEAAANPTAYMNKMSAKAAAVAANDTPKLTNGLDSIRPLAERAQTNPDQIRRAVEKAAAAAQTTGIMPLPKEQRFIQLPERPRTGLEVWKHFDLRSQLKSTALFSEGELNQIEQAFRNTDRVFYREDFSLKTDGWEEAANKGEEPWDYGEQLAKELRNTMPLSEKQWKKIVGSGPTNMGLRPYFRLVSLQNYVLYYGKMLITVGEYVIKGGPEAAKILSITERTIFLLNHNPTVPTSIIKDVSQNLSTYLANFITTPI